MLKSPIRVAMVANIGWNIYNFRLPLIHALQTHGFTVVLIAQEDEYTDRLRALGCRFCPLLHLSRKGTNPFQDIKLLLELRKAYLLEKIDLALHFTIKPNIYGSLAARWAGIPALSVVTGLGYTFLHDNFTAKVAKFLYKIAFRKLSALVFQNEADKELFITQQICDASLPTLIRGSGIDCQKFIPPANFDFNKRPFRFLFVGRLLYDKGIREYLQTARALKKQLGANVEFYILGGLDTDNPAAISGAELQIYVTNQEVVYVGKTDNVLPYVQSAHVVVLPSYREGLPRVLLEALAVARPIICTDTAGCKDMIINDANGILIPAQSSQHLINACTQLYQKNTTELTKMGNIGRNYAIHNFSDTIICQQFITLIQSILKI